jgi:urease accessory protein
VEKSDDLALLRLLQLADSALPVGAAAHSFGLESMVEDRLLSPENLEQFLRGYLEESGRLDAFYCRAAYRLSPSATSEWALLNQRLSARRMPREIRDANLALGRRFLLLAADLLREPLPLETEAHHVTAFGLAARLAGIAEQNAISGWLHQSVAALISAMQRLAPLGQSRASRILWSLKPLMAAIANPPESEPDCLSPLPEIAAMRHPSLQTRLFIS